MSDLNSDHAQARRLAQQEIERAADRLAKVHGKSAFNHAAQKVHMARQNGDDADHIFWTQIAEKLKREFDKAS